MKKLSDPNFNFKFEKSKLLHLRKIFKNFSRGECFAPCNEIIKRQSKDSSHKQIHVRVFIFLEAGRTLQVSIKQSFQGHLRNCCLIFYWFFCCFVRLIWSVLFYISVPFWVNHMDKQHGHIGTCQKHLESSGGRHAPGC